MSKNGVVLGAYYSEIEDRVAKAKKKLKKKRHFVPLDSYPWHSEMTAVLSRYPGAKIDVPPSHIPADIALSGVSPDKLDSLAKDFLKISFVEKVERAGIFLNVGFKRGKMYADILNSVAELEAEFGCSDIHKDKRVVIDYSHPNITKPIGVGHLRSTIIGEALARIYEATGYRVVRENYLGDWGTQFGKVIYAYKNWGVEEEMEKNPIVHLKDLYVRFHEEAEKNPKLEDEARAIFQKLEGGDEELLKLWKNFRDISILEFMKMYEVLGVEFDAITGEGMTTPSTAKVITAALEKGLAKKSDGAVVVEGLEGLPSFLLEKQDGSTLYLTRDVVTLGWRIKEFEPSDVLYVVGQEQNLHFKQLFALSRALGFLGSVHPAHVGFGLLMIGGKKMSTRKGTLVELDELIRESIEKSASIIKEKNTELSEKEIAEVSKIVGVGAVIYNDLRQSREKNIQFDWDRMLDFESGSAAYLQYTYARIQSILRKSMNEELRIKNINETNSSFTIPHSRFSFLFEDDSEWQLARKFMFFPGVIARAKDLNAPHLIATYMEELAQLFNHFYNKVQVLKTENEKLRNSRLMLISAVAEIIKNGLNLLNIKVPERM